MDTTQDLAAAQTITFDIDCQLSLKSPGVQALKKNRSAKRTILCENPDFKGVVHFSELKIEYCSPKECHGHHESVGKGQKNIKLSGHGSKPMVPYLGG